MSCYVPAGRWTRYLTGEVVEGPGWVRETHDFFSVPLLVRPGAVIPVGARQDRPDYDYRDGVTLRLFSPAEGRTAVVVPGPAGADTVFTVVREGAEIRVGRSGEALPWRVQLGTAITDLAADQDSCTLTLG